MEQPMIKIMIADDHDMVRLGLRTYLTMEPGFEVIGEADNGREVLRMLEGELAAALPDLILMDLSMPVMDGAEATAEVNRRYPGIKVIMLTSFLEEDQVVRAIEAGAVNYVLKTISSEDLIQVIRGAVRGMQIMDADVSQALTRGLRQRSAQEDGEEAFTLREKEVLLLIAEGKSNKEIAEELHISIKTVKTHVSNLLMKCELQDRTQLAIYAHRKGLAQ